MNDSSVDPDHADRFSDEGAEREERLVVAMELLAKRGGFPLSKSETLTAFALMGLTSRLQPLHTDSDKHQQRVVDLAVKLGTMTEAALGKRDERDE